MNRDDNQFKALFDSFRQRDRAAAPQFERMWHRAQPAQESSAASIHWWPALACAAGILLLISLAISLRSGEEEISDAPAAIDFEDTQLVVRRHFQNMTWTSPTAPFLGNEPRVQFADDDI